MVSSKNEGGEHTVGSAGDSAGDWSKEGVQQACCLGMSGRGGDSNLGALVPQFTAAGQCSKLIQKHGAELPGTWLQGCLSGKLARACSTGLVLISEGA